MSSLAFPVRAQSSDAPAVRVAPTAGISLGGPGSKYFHLGGLLTLSFVTRVWEARFSLEELAQPTGCFASYLTVCGDINGTYLDVTIGRRLATSADRRGAWQVGIGPSVGPHRARFISLHADRQVGVGRMGIVRIGARYRHGVGGEELWYGTSWPRFYSLSISLGAMGADR